MLSLEQVEEQLKNAGCNFRFWGRPEIRELPRLLMPGETIKHCVNGRYDGGFATLCVTNHRVLLIDRKFLFTNIEDIRFDMISELNYSSQVFDGTVHISTPSRKLRFVSFNRSGLQKLITFTQVRVMEIRQHYMLQQFQQPAAPQPVPGMVGSMVMQGSSAGSATQQMQLPNSPNPYTQLPVLLRRRHYPS
jgi:hypothetical protein